MSSSSPLPGTAVGVGQDPAHSCSGCQVCHGKHQGSDGTWMCVWLSAQPRPDLAQQLRPQGSVLLGKKLPVVQTVGMLLLECSLHSDNIE